MVKFRKTIEKFAKKGEKTGWTYLTIIARFAEKMNPGSKISFRVKGQLDQYKFESLALLPMGKGDFILPLNAKIRKAIGKQAGDTVTVEMELDKRPIALSADLMKCLKAEPASLAFFKSLPRSHQNYFSKWIEAAKTIQTKSKRIAMTVIAMSRNHGFQEMIRSSRKESIY